MSVSGESALEYGGESEKDRAWKGGVVARSKGRWKARRGVEAEVGGLIELTHGCGVRAVVLNTLEPTIEIASNLEIVITNPSRSSFKKR